MDILIYIMNNSNNFSVAVIGVGNMGSALVRGMILRAKFSKEQITICDLDEKKVEDPDINKKIKADYKRGWGMSLMEQLMDSVDVINDEDGCTIILTKRRG